MPPDSDVASLCNCLAVRQAARRVTQFYDRFLAPSALRTTQFSILSWLSRAGPMSIHALAQAMVMDRTTLGRNILPLERGVEIVGAFGDFRRDDADIGAWQQAGGVGIGAGFLSEGLAGDERAAGCGDGDEGEGAASAQSSGRMIVVRHGRLLVGRSNG